MSVPTSGLATLIPKPPAPPIIVNAKAGPDQWAAAIRQLILVAAGVASAFGFAHLAGQFSALLAIAGPAGGLAAFAMGQWKTRQMANVATTMANALPDNLAQVRDNSTP